MGNRYFGLGQIEWMEGGGGHCRDGRGGNYKNRQKGSGGWESDSSGRRTVEEGDNRGVD